MVHTPRDVENHPLQPVELLSIRSQTSSRIRKRIRRRKEKERESERNLLL